MYLQKSQKNRTPFMNVRFLPEFISFFQFRKGCAITNANVPFILRLSAIRLRTGPASQLTNSPADPAEAA
jgi:hypothetical protein